MCRTLDLTLSSVSTSSADSAGGAQRKFHHFHHVVLSTHHGEFAKNLDQKPYLETDSSDMLLTQERFARKKEFTDVRKTQDDFPLRSCPDGETHARGLGDHRRMRFRTGVVHTDDTLSRALFSARVVLRHTLTHCVHPHHFYGSRSDCKSIPSSHHCRLALPECDGYTSIFDTPMQSFAC